MKVRAYLRVAKTGRGSRSPYKIHASSKPDHRPLSSGYGRSETVLPTVAFAIDVDIPDKLFKQAEQVIAEITIPEDQAVIAAEVAQ